LNEKEEEEVYFSPTRGNVIFASGYDGWAFRFVSLKKKRKKWIKENNK